MLVEIVVFERGKVTVSANFRGLRGSSTNDCWRPWAITWRCLRDPIAVLTHYRRVTYGQTDGHSITANTRYIAIPTPTIAKRQIDSENAF